MKQYAIVIATFSNLKEAKIMSREIKKRIGLEPNIIDEYFENYDYDIN